MTHALKKVTIHLFNSLIVEHTSNDHEERIAYLERQLGESSGNSQIITTHINISIYKELENELKYLSKRLIIINGSADTLVKQRDDVLTTTQTTDTIEGEDYEDTRELLENQLLIIITRLSKVEDNTSKLYI
jgi:hypothetical protein